MLAMPEITVTPPSPTDLLVTAGMNFNLVIESNNSTKISVLGDTPTDITVVAPPSTIIKQAGVVAGEPVPGPAGPQGPAGRGITSTVITGEDLVISYTDGTSVNVGRVVGEDGSNGIDGLGISSAVLNGVDLVINYSDGTSVNVGRVVGVNGTNGANGINGTNGTNGTNGWSPVFGLVSDGLRRVLQVIDWTGGTGTKPATGLYVGPLGLTPNIGEGVDLRGIQGIQGIQGPAGPNIFGLTLRELFAVNDTNIQHGGCDLDVNTNRLYSVVTPNNQLRVTDFNGNLIQSITLANTPAANCRIFNNFLYVAITGGSSRILRYDLSNLGAAPMVINDAVPLSNPLGIDFAAGSPNRMFVADISNNRVVVINTANNLNLTSISTGSNTLPTGVAVDAVNNLLYVVCRTLGATTAFIRRYDLTTYLQVGVDSVSIPNSVPGAGIVYDANSNLVYFGGLRDTGNNTPTFAIEPIRCYISSRDSNLVLSRLFSVGGRVGGIVVRNGRLYAGLSSNPSQAFKIGEIQL